MNITNAGKTRMAIDSDHTSMTTTAANVASMAVVEVASVVVVVEAAPTAVALLRTKSERGSRTVAHTRASTVVGATAAPRQTHEPACRDAILD